MWQAPSAASSTKILQLQTVLKYLRPGTKILKQRWERTNSNIPQVARSLSRTHTSRSSLCLCLRIRPHTSAVWGEQTQISTWIKQWKSWLWLCAQTPCCLSERLTEKLPKFSRSYSPGGPHTGPHTEEGDTEKEGGVRKCHKSAIHTHTHTHTVYLQQCSKLSPRGRVHSRTYQNRRLWGLKLLGYEALSY